jgi:hypothetical protein
MLNGHVRFSGAQLGMGVYVFESLYAPVIKIGHYKGNNAWSRIARRGFHSASPPESLNGRVNVDDFYLRYWFPSRNRADEIQLQGLLGRWRIAGEWFHADGLPYVALAISDKNFADRCDKNEAIIAKKRL